MPPFTRLPPLNVKEATDVVPDDVSGVDPMVALPSLNETVPVGAAVPLDGVTVAVSCETPSAGILATLAAMTVEVLTLFGVTVTVAAPTEFVKLPVAL